MKTDIVKLDLPPEERWKFLALEKDAINELLTYYLNDFKNEGLLQESIQAYKSICISDQYSKEIKCISSICDFTEDEILIANLYYDLLKFYFGCTAFATYSEKGMRHARNLDWHTDNNLLSKHSMIFEFQEKEKTIYKSIGWPGFIGVLSGVKPNAFSLTLNAVSSMDQAEIAMPISFLLRDILHHCDSFQEAKEKLEITPIINDCLILLSGISSDEKIVIERTPLRYATRTNKESYIIVTNDYKMLENEVLRNSLLQNTSCSRYDRTLLLLEDNKPKENIECLAILQDEEVMMGITVQQMVINNQTGEILLLKTKESLD